MGRRENSPPSDLSFLFSPADSCFLSTLLLLRTLHCSPVLYARRDFVLSSASFLTSAVHESIPFFAWPPSPPAHVLPSFLNLSLFLVLPRNLFSFLTPTILLSPSSSFSNFFLPVPCRPPSAFSSFFLLRNTAQLTAVFLPFFSIARVYPSTSLYLFLPLYLSPYPPIFPLKPLDRLTSDVSEEETRVRLFVALFPVFFFFSFCFSLRSSAVLLSFAAEKMIKFILLVNKQGQTRLSQYYDFLTIPERVALEGELIRKCLSRTEMQCSFIQYRQYNIVYRR